jgi:Protein of unknown function (DUF2934)
MDQSKSVAANDIASNKHAAPPRIKSLELASHANAKVPGDISPSEAEQRHAMIAKAAYLTSEQRHFEAGHDVEDWLAAERALNLS